MLKTTISKLLIIAIGVTSCLPAHAAPPENPKTQVDMSGFVLSGIYSEPSGQPTGSGSFANGNVGAYPEGSCVPALIEATNSGKADGDLQFTITYDYKKHGNPDDFIGIDVLEEIVPNFTGDPNLADNLDDFTFTNNDFSSTMSFESSTGTTIYANISGPNNSTNNKKRFYDVTLQNVPAGVTVYVTLCSRLGLDASQAFTGSSLSVSAKGSEGSEGSGGGGGTMPINGSELLLLPSLTIEKIVADGNATPDMWNFNVSPQINEQSTYNIITGYSSVTIDNVPTGIYEITEGDGPDGYSFAYGQGTNCVFDGATAYVDLKPAKPQMQAVCKFTNSMEPIVPPATTGTLIIVKEVINDNGGTGVAEDFELNLDYFDVQATSTETFAGNASGTEFVLEAGAYSVYETENGSYNASYSEGCSGYLEAGTTTTCTVTNDDIYTPPNDADTGKLTVIKRVMHLSEGESEYKSENEVTAGDFTLKINLTTSSTTSTITFPGDEQGTVHTLEVGDYNVTEELVSGYRPEYSGDCSGHLAAGEEKTCTVYNYYSPEDTARLIVKKIVINDNGRTATSSDFTINVSYTEPPFYGTHLKMAMAHVLAVLPRTATTSFPGDAEGTELIVGPGEYLVTEVEDPNYTVTYSEKCAGTIHAGQTITCIITNNDKSQGGGGGGSSSGGGGSSFAGFLGGAPTASPAPTPMVLGAEDTAPRCVLTEVEALQVSPIVNEILGYLGLSRDTTLEDYFNTILTPRVAPLDLDSAILAAVRNFVNYGTKSTVRLGQGERAGVLDSYKAIYGRMPVDECDWQNAIKIGNTTLPQDLNTEREKSAEQTFSKIYGMSVDRSNSAHDVALKVMTYGIRPQIRDLDAERTAIGVFERIFGKKPTTATEWDANRAIAYSGIAHSLLSKDLTKAASKMMSIRINNEVVR